MRSTSVSWLIATGMVGTACHTMAPMSWDEVAAERPSAVWITRENQIVVVSGPQVFNDTLVGYVNGEFDELPISEVTKVSVRRPARAKTIALVTASTAAAALAAVWMSGLGPKPKDDDPVDCGLDPDHPACQ